ncbi:MAG: site-2 protease family protein [Phycisphaeraceae bacterium]|nr:site-2 protease family protein [Phycisphaeraceae bacterium]
MLRGSLKLGSLFGVPIFIHWTFLLLLAWFMSGPLLAGGPDAVGASLRVGFFVLAIFGCVLLHEFGHVLAARGFGVPTRDVTLLPIGGVARLERMPEKPAQELLVALAGPAVNVVIAAVLIPLVLILGGGAALVSGEAGAEGAARSDVAGALLGHHANFLAALAKVNVLLVIFNMIPALPMDGGRVLRSLLAMVTDRARATAVSAVLGQLLAVGFALLGVLSGNILLIVIAAFVFLGAGGEAQAEQIRSALVGLPVRAAMITHFKCLRASQRLREAAGELLAGSQQDFPVLRDDAMDLDATALVGVLTRSDLVRAVAAGQMDDRVSTVMTPLGPFAREDDDLREVLERARQGEGGVPPIIGVVRSDHVGAPLRLVGLITAENVTELVMLRHAAMASRR